MATLQSNQLVSALKLSLNPFAENLKLDCIRWVIESSQTDKQRSVERIVQQMIALLFASYHQMPMVSVTEKQMVCTDNGSSNDSIQALVFAVYNLCMHPEYIAPLRQEMEIALQGTSEERFKDIPLLDSFLRESSRLNPLDACKFLGPLA